MGRRSGRVADRPLNVLSLCTGVAGLDLGLRIAAPHARTVCYVEREAFACEVLAARMDEGALDAAPVWTDLDSFSGYAWRGHVDLVLAGFPCQPASVAGARRGRDDERWLWPTIARIIRDVGPGLVCLENVPGLLADGILGDVLGSLASLGFDAEWGVYSAAEVGASHLRERLFVVAYAGREWLQRLQPEPIGWGSTKTAPRQRCEEMAYPDRERRQGIGRSRAIGGGIAPREDPEMANADDERRARSEGDATDDARLHRGAELSGATMADANGAGCEGDRLGWILDGERTTQRNDVDGCSRPGGG